MSICVICKKKVEGEAWRVICDSCDKKRQERLEQANQKMLARPSSGVGVREPSNPSAPPPEGAI